MKQTEQEIFNTLHIKLPVSEFQNNDSPAKFIELFNNLMIRMSEGGLAPMPLMNFTVVTLDLAGQEPEKDEYPDVCQTDLYVKVEDELGNKWFPLFSERAEIGEDLLKSNVVKEIPIREIIYAGYFEKDVQGVVINPNSQCFSLPKEYLKLMVGQEDTYGEVWKACLRAIDDMDK